MVNGMGEKGKARQRSFRALAAFKVLASHVQSRSLSFLAQHHGSLNPPTNYGLNAVEPLLGACAFESVRLPMVSTSQRNGFTISTDNKTTPDNNV